MIYPINLLICLERNPSNDGHVALSEQLEEISSGMDASINVLWKHPIEAASEITNVKGVIVPNDPTPLSRDKFCAVRQPANQRFLFSESVADFRQRRLM